MTPLPWSASCGVLGGAAVPGSTQLLMSDGLNPSGLPGIHAFRLAGGSGGWRGGTRDIPASGLFRLSETGLLTGLGRSLGTALAPLDRWAQTWSTAVRQEVQAQVERGT